jgi:glutamate-1-semialdehyde aminotransferase/spore coat polysaccharide biosynthesis protein SpsF (cytidylyltransferase family)
MVLTPIRETHGLKTTAIIQARCGSTRFPGKVLEKIDGKTLLEIELERLKGCETLDGILVATTGSPADDPIVDLCQKVSVPVFRGSEHDVLDRYYWAAQQVRADVVVRLTSDCPLLDPLVVDRVVSLYLANRNLYQYVANTAPPPGTFPDGMDVEVFSFDSLKEAWQKAQKRSDREHVTFYFWKQPGKFKIFRVEAPQNWSKIRLTVDYPEDLEVVRTLYLHFQKSGQNGTLEEISAYIHEHPELLSKNTHSFGEGWAPALQADAAPPSPEARKATPLKLEETEKAWSKAIRLIPGGAQTFSKAPAQFVNGVAPKMLVRGRGCKVWDLDGNEYIDYTLGLGPAILGHAHPEVIQAAANCAADLFNVPPLPHPLESTLAEKIVSLIPCAQMIKFGKNGSDATAGAVRLARACTGRDIIACCGYHGWQDWYIGSTSRWKGVPLAVRQLTRQFQYNRLDTLEKIFSDHPGNVAGVILEPVTFTPPEGDFLQKVKDLCAHHGTVLIFDETITGFRMDMRGAQGHFGIVPDLATFGKAIANGYPLSILCGKAEIMRRFDEVFYSFTFGGELPPIAAALKTIEILEREKGIEHIAAMGKIFRDGLNHIADELEVRFLQCIGYDFWPEYIFQETNDFSALEILSLMQQEIVRRGILTRAAPLISLAHSSYNISETLRIFRESLLVVREAVKTRKVREWLEGDVIQAVIRQPGEITDTMPQEELSGAGRS